MTIFQGFSPSSFEQFIRVLALEVLGPGVTVFGTGPDGGRDACFRGTLAYPFPPAQQWSGYGIIQAKFKQKLESTRKDQSWAVAQLTAELNDWREKRSRGAAPQYYIFCTNVELTAAARGGRSRMEGLLQEAANSLSLKDFCIWDGTQLRCFVDKYKSIRDRFSCFFTTGDLLACFARKLAWNSDPDSILSAFLCREIEMLLVALEDCVDPEALLPVLLATCAFIPQTRWDLSADAEEIKHRYLLAHPSAISTLEPLALLPD